MPSIGRLDYLDQTLQSLDRQTLRDFELIILDNASGIEAAERFREFAATRPNVRHERVGERLPMFANFNRGIEAARGKYVAFFFDDDVYAPEFLEAMTRMLEAHPTAGFAGSDYIMIDDHGKRIGRRNWVKKTELWPGARYADYLLARGRNLVSTPGLVFRRETLQPDGFDESISIHFGDFVLLLKIAERWDVAILADPLISVRIHAGAASSIPLSRSIPIRSTLLLEYCASMPTETEQQRTRRRRSERNVLRGEATSLIWGWITSDDAESRACREALRATGRHSFISATLGLLRPFRWAPMRKVVHAVGRMASGKDARS